MFNLNLTFPHNPILRIVIHLLVHIHSKIHLAVKSSSFGLPALTM